MMIIINHPQGKITLDELQKDVDMSIKKYGAWQYAFTPMTVQALIDKIREVTLTQ